MAGWLHGLRRALRMCRHIPTHSRPNTHSIECHPRPVTHPCPGTHTCQGNPIRSRACPEVLPMAERLWPRLGTERRQD